MAGLEIKPDDWRKQIWIEKKKKESFSRGNKHKIKEKYLPTKS